MNGAITLPLTGATPNGGTYDAFAKTKPNATTAAISSVSEPLRTRNRINSGAAAATATEGGDEKKQVSPSLNVAALRSRLARLKTKH